MLERMGAILNISIGDIKRTSEEGHVAGFIFVLIVRLGFCLLLNW